MTPEEIKELALGMPQNARVDLIHELQNSLIPDPGLEEKWEEEASRRATGIRNGSRKTLTHAEVFGHEPRLSDAD